MSKLENDSNANITRHCWLNDGKFIACTENGSILLFESTGDYKNVQIEDSKRPKFPIHSVCAYQVGGQDFSVPADGKTKQPTGSQRSGFIVAGNNGHLRVFYKSDATQATGKPYVRVEGDDLELPSEARANERGEQSNPQLY